LSLITKKSTEALLVAGRETGRAVIGGIYRVILSLEVPNYCLQKIMLLR